MGKALIIMNMNWASKNLGMVTFLQGLTIDGNNLIAQATTYFAFFEGEPKSVNWSVSGDATLSATSGSSIILTPTDNGIVTLTATLIEGGETYTTSKFITVALPTMNISPFVEDVSTSTTFTAYYGEDIDTSVAWSISDNTLVSLTDYNNGTCVIEPLVEDNQTAVTLTATGSNGTKTITFVPFISTMPEGYTRMAFIQAHSAYIDTGVTPDSSTRLVIDGQALHTHPNSSFAYLFDDSGVHNIYLNFGTTSRGIKFSGLTTSGFTFVPDFKRHTIDLSQSRLIYDGTEYQNTTSEPASWTSTKTIRLLGGINASTNRNASSRIYRCKIYNGASVVRDFVPCKRNSDNVLGLYDVENSTFYPATSGILYGLASEPAYITNGLIAKFDGLDASAAYWGDTYGSIFGVKLPSGTTKTTDKLGVVFTGEEASDDSNPGNYANANAVFKHGSTTIEVVYKVDTAPNAIMMLVKGYHAQTESLKSNFGFYITSSGVVRNDIFTVRETNLGNVNDRLGNIVTQSITSSLNYVNGVSLGKGDVSSSTITPTATGSPSIGGWTGSSSWFPFAGTIYMVRIYNRELTAEEIAHNQAIDMARYNISNN